MIPTKFESREEIQRGSKEREKAPKGDLKINSKGNETNSMMNIYHFILEVNKVFRGQLLIERVMVMEQKTICGGSDHKGCISNLVSTLRRPSATTNPTISTSLSSVAFTIRHLVTPSNARN